MTRFKAICPSHASHESCESIEFTTLQIYAHVFFGGNTYYGVDDQSLELTLLTHSELEHA